MTLSQKIEIMQSNLSIIRKVLGLSAKDLGELIGVTRQTINNIESGKYKMSKTQYLAIMYVLEHDISPILSEIEKAYIQILLISKEAYSVYIKPIISKEES